MKKRRTKRCFPGESWVKFWLKMKMLTFLMFTVFAVSASNTYSQLTRFNMNLTGVTIKQLFSEIEQKSEFILLYNKKDLDLNRKVDVNVRDESVGAILDQVFTGTENTYKIYDRQIVILKEEKIVVPEGGSQEQLQKKQIRGNVKDKSGQSLPGVSVVVKGTIIGTVTDGEGNFTLEIPGNARTLQFSFVGMKTQDVPVGEENFYVVVMEEDIVEIDEVVSIGYGTMKRGDMTGAASSIRAQEISKIPVKSFDEAIAGRIAGVQIVSTDGQPGSLPNIIIRGTNSITQDSSPLYVVDGFPIEDNDNNSINPSDIESIDVLKDASATAIYGARGANGVIMITTKRGKAGATVVSYNGYTGFQKVTDRIEMMDPYEFVKLQLEINASTSTTSYLTNPGMTLDDYKSIESIDWFDRALQSAPMQNHEISVRGGNATSRYSVSGSYFGQDGIFLNTGFRRWQGRVTLDQEISKKISFGMTANYSDTKNYGLVAANGGWGAGIMYSIWAYRPIFPDPDIDLDYDLMDPGVNPASDYRLNPVLQLKNEFRESFSNTLMANSYLEYAITKELKLRISGGMNKGTYQSDIFNNSLTQTGNPASPAYKGINGSETISNPISFSNENTLTWTKKLKNHSLTLLAGFSQQMGKTAVFGATAVMLTNENMGMSGMDEGAPSRITASRSVWTLNSFLSRLNYNYKSKFLLTASMRADGSSKLAPENRWGYFPSAALAYRISSENFMQNINAVSDAKLRISYGATGNNRVSDFAYMSSISSSYNDYTFGNATPSPGSRATALGNASLKWETTLQFNTGIDISLLKNRISFTGDYYSKKTTDLLLNAEIPYISGYSTAYKNVGSISNKGFELTLNTVNIQKSDFKWNSGFNISFNRNKILSLTDGQESIISTGGISASAKYIGKVGHPIAQFYGAIDDGLYSYDDFDVLTDGSYRLKAHLPSNGNVRTSIRPGDVKFKDLNGDLTITTLDVTVIGDPNPDFIGGFNNNFQYKGFDLNVFFQFSYGNDVLNMNKYKFCGGDVISLNTNVFAEYEDRWTVENPNGKNPRLGGFGTLTVFPSRFIEDASFLRVKTVSLGYTIPSAILKSISIKTLRVYCTAQNLYTWTKYSGLDPEVSTRNSALTPALDWSPYPRAKSFVFGVNVTF